MRFVETKTPEQQSCLMLHRTRQLFIRQQTSVINAIRAHLAEFGIVAPVGRKGVAQLLDVVADARDKRVPEVARACVAALGAQLRMLKAQILEFDRRILAWHRSNETSRRLDAIPGIGPALATALERFHLNAEIVIIRCVPLRFSWSRPKLVEGFAPADRMAVATLGAAADAWSRRAPFGYKKMAFPACRALWSSLPRGCGDSPRRAGANA
jgi:hypothetical protein